MPECFVTHYQSNRPKEEVYIALQFGAQKANMLKDFFSHTQRSFFVTIGSMWENSDRS